MKPLVPPAGNHQLVLNTELLAAWSLLFSFWNLTVYTEQKLRNLNFHDGAETTTILTDAGRALIASH